MSDLAADAALARLIAEAAGSALLSLLQSSSLTGADLGQEGDRIANALIMDALSIKRPDDAVLCEEEPADLARLDAQRVWIVDPLDGTREFGEGRTDWAVHVALAIGGHAVVGAVALPGVGETYCSDSVLPLRSSAATLKMVVSRTRPAPEAVAVAQALSAELIPMGSAGAKAMAVVRGDADIYLHSGGQYEWDNCAPAAVAVAAGLHVSRLDGSPLLYNRADADVPDLLICRAALAEPVLKRIAAGFDPL